ncbi:hypothetical protein IKQ21_09855 [bacterium]|nr:hypothetical protein [bacterium]
MKVDNNYKLNHSGSANFTALKLKNNKKWSQTVLNDMKRNKEFQKLVDIYDKKGLDVVAEYVPMKGSYSDVVILKDSENNILSLSSSAIFKYDLFNSSYAIRDFDMKKHKRQDIKTKDTGFFKRLFANIKKCLGI